MNQIKFKNQAALSEEAEKLGKKAIQLGLISNFAIRFFADAWQFELPDENVLEPLTPEEAYLYFKKLVEED